MARSTLFVLLAVFALVAIAVEATYYYSYPAYGVGYVRPYAYTYGYPAAYAYPSYGYGYYLRKQMVKMDGTAIRNNNQNQTKDVH